VKYGIFLRYSSDDELRDVENLQLQELESILEGLIRVKARIPPSLAGISISRNSSRGGGQPNI